MRDHLEQLTRLRRPNDDDWQESARDRRDPRGQCQSGSKKRGRILSHARKISLLKAYLSIFILIPYEFIINVFIRMALTKL